MREQELIEKIESQVKIFKSRVIKGYSDDKRHDTIKRDEQKWMWTAHNKLGWSYAKIGSIFGRDPRTAQKAVGSYKNVERVAKQKPYEETPHKQQMRDLKEIAVTLPPLRPPTVPPAHPAINIGDLKIAPSPIGTKLVSIGPLMFFPEPPLPAYANISIRLHVQNPSDASITISGISYRVTINGNYAGTGSVPGVYTIPPHSEPEIDAPFRADFHTGGSVVISAIMSKELQIELTGTAHYQSSSHSEDKPFSGVIPVTLQLPYLLS